MFLFDVALVPSGVGIFLAVVFFLLFAGVAAFAFFMIRKTVKMALRMAIVGLILVIAFVGSLALFFGIGSSPSRPNRSTRPPVNSTR